MIDVTLFFIILLAILNPTNDWSINSENSEEIQLEKLCRANGGVLEVKDDGKTECSINLSSEKNSDPTFLIIYLMIGFGFSLMLILRWSKYRQQQQKEREGDFDPFRKER